MRNIFRFFNTLILLYNHFWSMTTNSHCNNNFISNIKSCCILSNLYNYTRTFCTLYNKLVINTSKDGWKKEIQTGTKGSSGLNWYFPIICKISGKFKLDAWIDTLIWESKIKFIWNVRWKDYEEEQEEKKIDTLKRYSIYVFKC